MKNIRKMSAKPTSKKWTNWLLLGGMLLGVSLSLVAEEKKDDKKKEAPPAKAPDKKKEEAKTPDEKAPEKKDGEKKAEKADAAGPEEASAVPEPKGGFLFPEKEVYTKDEVQALRAVLEQKSTQLDQDIDSQKKYLESLKGQTEDHLKKIESARNEIADFMNTRDEKEEGKLKKLARFYEAMDPEQAAPLLKDVNDDLAIKIFDRMDTKKAGTILAQLPAPRAARLTSQFPRLKLQVEKTAQAASAEKQ